MSTTKLVVVMTDPINTAKVEAEAGEARIAMTSLLTAAPQTQQSGI